MIYSRRIKIAIILFPIVFLSGCSGVLEPEYSDIVYLAGTPIITGFYVTTIEQPDGTGEVIGNPAYKINEINVFPNPYIDEIPDEINQLQRFVTFNHLPLGNVTIIIVKGISRDEEHLSNPSYFGTSNLQRAVPIIKTIVKTDSSHFARWNLNNSIASGYYRAYIFGESVPKNYFIDFSLTIKQLGPIRF